MKDPSAAALTGAVTLGLLVAVVALGNAAIDGYGQAFLDVLASIYPGYSADGSIAGVLIVTAYSVIDGAIAGFLIAWLYGRFAR